MYRDCSHCHRPFTPQDLVKEESKGMEAERKALGLEGIRFLYYSCPACKYDDIFVDILPLQDETPEQFQKRRRELEATVRQVRGEKTDVVVVPAATRNPPSG